MLKFFGAACAVMLLLLLASGQDLVTAVEAALAFGPLLAMTWSIVFSLFGHFLTAQMRKPTLLWHLFTVRRELAPASRFWQRWWRRGPPVIFMDASRCLFSTIRDGLFIQECLSPTTGSDDEEGNPFLPHVDAKACCRILISLDAARTWNLSQAGRLDLTREAKRDWFSDPEFDREVFLIGPQARALAVLTPVMRKKFVALIDPVWGQVSLQCDPLAVQLMPDLSSLRLPQFSLPSAKLVRTMVDSVAPFLRELLIADEDVVPALVANAAADPSGLVRRRILDALLSLSPKRADLDRAVALVRSDREPAVQVWVAKVAGDAWGLKRLSRMAQEPTVDSALRSEAAGVLLDHWGIRETWPALEGAFRLAGMIEKEQLVRRLLCCGDLHVFGLLAELAKTCEAGAAAVVTTELGRCRHTMAEDVLTELLDCRDPCLRLAAVKALGEAGTYKVLPLLVELADNIDLATVAEESIARIRFRSRLGEPGGLSLSEPGSTAGAVSVTEADGEGEVI